MLVWEVDLKDQISEVEGKVRQLLLKRGELDAARLSKLIDVTNVTADQALNRLASKRRIVIRTDRSKTLISLRRRRIMGHATPSLRRNPSCFTMYWKQRSFLD